MVDKSKPLDVYKWDDEDDIAPCADCGDDVEVGQKYVYEPAPEAGPRASVVAHDYCAVRNGYQLEPGGR